MPPSQPKDDALITRRQGIAQRVGAFVRTLGLDKSALPHVSRCIDSLGEGRRLFGPDYFGALQELGDLADLDPGIEELYLVVRTATDGDTVEPSMTIPLADHNAQLRRVHRERQGASLSGTRTSRMKRAAHDAWRQIDADVRRRAPGLKGKTERAKSVRTQLIREREKVKTESGSALPRIPAVDTIARVLPSIDRRR